MKKHYISPNTEVVFIAQTLLTSVSMKVDNNPQNNVSGDAKERGDWDIWGEDI